jgi:hypothetical protein
MIDTCNAVFGMFNGLSDSAILFGGIFNNSMNFLKEHRGVVATVVGVVTTVVVYSACVAVGTAIGTAIGGPGGGATGAMWGARVGIALGITAGVAAGYFTYQGLGRWQDTSTVTKGVGQGQSELERLNEELVKEHNKENAAKSEQERLEQKLIEIKKEEERKRIEKEKEEERKKEEAARREIEQLEKEKAELLRPKESKLILIRDKNANGTTFSVLDFCDGKQQGNTETIQGKNLDEVSFMIEQHIDKFFVNEKKRNPNGKDKELILLNEPFPGDTPRNKIEVTAKRRNLRFQYYGKDAPAIKDYHLNTQ